MVGICTDTLRRAFALALITVLLASLAPLAGCAWIGSALETMGGADPTGTAGAGSQPGSTREGEEPAGPTEYAAPNPVFLLYTDYLAALNAACGGIIEAAAECDDAVSAGAYMRFCSCEAKLTAVYSTVGLMAPDGSGWSGMFSPPFAGSGSMSSRGLFEFLFDDGRVIAGRAGSDMLEYGIGPGEAPFDPDEPTPEASAAPTEEPAAEPTGGTGEPTGEATEEATPEPTAEPTPAGASGSRFDPPDWRELARSVSGDREYAALLRTDTGFVAVVLDAGGLSIIEIADGALYFAADAGSAVLAGLDPFSGLSGLSVPACDILQYSGGALKLSAA